MKRSRSIIYFAERNGQIKIGFSKAPLSRIASLPGAKIVAWTNGSRTKEARIHDALHDFRLRGEWFSDCEEVRNYISLNARTSKVPMLNSSVSVKINTEDYLIVKRLAKAERRSIAEVLRAAIGHYSQIHWTTHQEVPQETPKP